MMSLKASRFPRHRHSDNRVPRYEKARSDLLVAQALGDQLSNLHLSLPEQANS